MCLVNFLGISFSKSLLVINICENNWEKCLNIFEVVTLHACSIYD